MTTIRLEKRQILDAMDEARVTACTHTKPPIETEITFGNTLFAPPTRLPLCKPCIEELIRVYTCKACGDAVSTEENMGGEANALHDWCQRSAQIACARGTPRGHTHYNSKIFLTSSIDIIFSLSAFINTALNSVTGPEAVSNELGI